MGRVSLEYRYQLALARLQARHPGVEIELDPFVTLPEDADGRRATFRRFPTATRRMSFGCYLFLVCRGFPSLPLSFVCRTQNDNYYQHVVMVWVSIVPIPKGDLRVLATSRPLFDRGSGVGFPG
ncbi:hypothetical protein BHE74_00011983 [Ensete ventricosum]|nr:hypothetical protein BHE74_00011983 [Ensete ventricosum]